MICFDERGCVMSINVMNLGRYDNELRNFEKVVLGFLRNYVEVEERRSWGEFCLRSPYYKTEYVFELYERGLMPVFWFIGNGLYELNFGPKDEMGNVKDTVFWRKLLRGYMGKVVARITSKKFCNTEVFVTKEDENDTCNSKRIW